ncbi:cytochrome c oxidase subunit 7A, mitochondrial-like [Condylostylus longicornis]|uniref:cytochrome c oxidase subunit 7A, mitochondrial-like n=1 Tax=Condylostylus longicornis TaxID=2530218 RepID=UPI00244DC914|nr:cytochrome c oxidase subunit 7A, mitochondrial-like [Condylostylus longicornis]
MNVSRVLVRNIATTATRSAKGEIAPGYKELKKIQERFQVKDGKPVFLKGGPMDQFLYGVTVVGCLAGVGGILQLLYQLSFPSKPE